MRLDSLIHIARSVQTMMEADRLVVFGSASLLATFPELGDLPGSPLQSTYDADLIPYPFEEQIGMMLDEAFGEDRGFHQKFGYHADIVRPKVTETFPADWESRLVRLDVLENVFFLEPHDTVAAKCIVARDKDREQISYLLNHNLIDEAEVRERINMIQLGPEKIAACNAFLDKI
ncbi:MAG: hypothetical protein KJO79_05920 [Verrucomicrobiae bacterium]|nr:hypothetical protein [Verrucomicrobiae bacterium]NNJ86699.1 hypothetical protein [Akkermansiaceae bacterium]